MSEHSHAARPRVAFALSGGGAHGAAQVGMLQALLEAGIVPDVILAQVGMLQALLEAGIVPDVILGCSVGALNGVYIAADPTVERATDLAGLWLSLQRKDVFGSRRRKTLANALARRDHVYENTALLNTIKRMCPVIDLADLQVETHVVTTDLDAARPHWWSHGPARPILQATTALPGVFAPVLMPGPTGPSRHIDGGIAVPVPTAQAASMDVDVVYVLDVAQGTAPAPERLNAFEVLLRSFSISRYANQPHHGTLARPGQEIVLLPSPSTAGRDMRDFSNSAAYISQAYDSASELLAARASVSTIEGQRNSWLRRAIRPGLRTA
jgi:NTE family protein